MLVKVRIARRPWVFCLVLATATGAILALSGCVPQIGTIGAMLGQRGDGRLFVRDAPAELSASAEGLEEGDEILLIDGRDVRKMSDDELHHALSGDVGSRVKITAVRGDQVLRVTLTRSAAPRSPNRPGERLIK
jgi:C-terminal processing protease CtpA/Prc